MSEVVPGAPVPEYSGNSVDNAPSGGAPTSSTPNGDASSNAAAQRPALSPESTAAIAAAKGIDVEDVANVTWKNAAMVYRLP